jgi:hypothetical protein
MPKPVQNTRAVNKEAVVLSATADSFYKADIACRAEFSIAAGQQCVISVLKKMQSFRLVILASKFF